MRRGQKSYLLPLRNAKRLALYAVSGAAAVAEAAPAEPEPGQSNWHPDAPVADPDRAADKRPTGPIRSRTGNRKHSVQGHVAGRIRLEEVRPEAQREVGDSQLLPLCTAWVPGEKNRDRGQSNSRDEVVVRQLAQP